MFILSLACWRDILDDRPTMQQVVPSLKTIMFLDNNDETNKKGLSNEILIPDSSISNHIEDYDLVSIENECNLDILDQAERLFMEIFDSVGSLLTN